MDLEDFVGEHRLLGYEDCDEGCKFVLDGATIVATEDENDGYRSMLKDVRMELGGVRNLFPPCDVVGHMDDEILVLVDKTTGKTVLRVGTDDADDYYPVFTAEFTPEHMAINKDKV